MKISKKGIIICLVIVITAIICFLIVLFTGQKKNEIKLGMSCEEVISIAEQNQYQYEIIGGGEVVWLKEIVICDIKGNIYMDLDSDNKISNISFLTDLDDFDKKIAVLYEYLSKSYGRPVKSNEDDISDPFKDKLRGYWFQKNDMIIYFSYPISEGYHIVSIGIQWHY